MILMLRVKDSALVVHEIGNITSFKIEGDWLLIKMGDTEKLAMAFYKPIWFATYNDRP